MIPEISVEQLAERLRSSDGFILLDVREPWEVALAALRDTRLILQPMSELARRGVEALPDAARQKDAEIYVLCHLGVRSADVTGWLASQGWINAYSVAGGIDAYARLIEPEVGLY
jgi:rhodanese-related sulfurtransferase